MSINAYIIVKQLVPLQAMPLKLKENAIGGSYTSTANSMSPYGELFQAYLPMCKVGSVA